MGVVIKKKFYSLEKTTRIIVNVKELVSVELEILNERQIVEKERRNILAFFGRFLRGSE